jgi:hypothetical protein
VDNEHSLTFWGRRKNLVGVWQQVSLLTHKLSLESLSRPVLPGGRGHRQITQNRPYKKIICGEKLMAVKVAVSGNKVL